MILKVNKIQLRRMKNILKDLNRCDESTLCPKGNRIFTNSECNVFCGKIFPSLVDGSPFKMPCPCSSGLSPKYIKKRTRQVIRENEAK